MERNKDFYANEWNGFKGLFRSINQYFKSESNKIFIEPLEFMHLLDEKLQYIKNNLDKPFSTVNHLNNSFNSEIEKHIIYRFILKAYNATYPFSLHDSIQISPLLKLIEIEFLSFKEDTPEKLDYLDGSASYLTESKASSYKFNKNDFKNISTNYDFDFFYKCEQLKEGVEWLPFKINSINVVFKTIEHFERGKRKGLIEPLAFLNLNFKYYSLLIENPESRYATIDLIRELRIDDEVKHILWGFILLWIREYYKINSVIEYQFDKDILNEIEEEFLSYDGYTPEKQFLKYPTKEIKEILDKYYPKLGEWVKILAKWYSENKEKFHVIQNNMSYYVMKNGYSNSNDFDEFIGFLEHYTLTVMDKNLINHELSDYDYVMYLEYRKLKDTQNYSNKSAIYKVWQKIDNRNPETAFKKMVTEEAEPLFQSHVRNFIIKSLKIPYLTTLQSEESLNEYLLKQVSKISLKLIVEEITELEIFINECNNNYRLKDAIEGKYPVENRLKYEYLKIVNGHYNNILVNKTYETGNTVARTYAKYILFYEWLKELRDKLQTPQIEDKKKKWKKPISAMAMACAVTLIDDYTDDKFIPREFVDNDDKFQKISRKIIEKFGSEYNYMPSSLKTAFSNNQNGLNDKQQNDMIAFLKKFGYTNLATNYENDIKRN